MFNKTGSPLYLRIMTLYQADDMTTTDYVTDDPESKIIPPCDSLLQEGCPCRYGHFGCPRGQVCILGKCR